MKVVEQTNSKLVVRHEISTATTILSIFLLFPAVLVVPPVIGFIFMLALTALGFRESETSHSIGKALSLAFLVLAISFVYLGLIWFFIWNKPSNYLTIDRNLEQITYTSTNWLRQKSQAEFFFEDLDSFSIKESEFDGGCYYYLILTSKSGECLHKTQLPFAAGYGLDASQTLVGLMNEYIKIK